LGTHLFVKISRQREREIERKKEREESEVTISVFESSCYLLLPVGSVAKRVKAPFLWRPCDLDRLM